MAIGPWFCDTCGEPTVDATNGYVTWARSVGTGPFSIKIVHQGERCDRQQGGQSGDLASFLGPDGIVRLTSWLSLGPIKVDAGQGRPELPADLDEFVDFLRRVQVPGYEQVRHRYREDEVRADFYDAGESLPYLQETLVHLR